MPLPGACHRDFLERNGEGINHICFNVRDIQGKTAELVEKGCEITFSVGTEDSIGENYIDTSKFGNVWFSMRPPTSEWNKARMASSMAHPLVSNWKFRGVGMAVRDIDKAVEYYQSLNLGTFRAEVMLDSGSCEDFKAYGKTPDTIVKARTRTTQVGPLEYEFVQPLEGEDIYKESLDSRGESVINITFTVDDLDKETAALVEKGAPVILSGKPQSGGAFAYFDTRKIGNTMVKLIQAE